MAQAARANAFTWQNIEEMPDGCILATMLAPDRIWAASLALAYGPGVTVLEPEAVRQEVYQWAQEIVKLYS